MSKFFNLQDYVTYSRVGIDEIVDKKLGYVYNEAYAYALGRIDGTNSSKSELMFFTPVTTADIFADNYVKYLDDADRLGFRITKPLAICWDIFERNDCKFFYFMQYKVNLVYLDGSHSHVGLDFAETDYDNPEDMAVSAYNDLKIKAEDGRKNIYYQAHYPGESFSSSWEVYPLHRLQDN